MPSPECLDFAALLAPISEEAPCGAALRGGEPDQRVAFQKVKDARELCRAAERTANNSWGGEDQPELDPPDWSSVKAAAIDVLTTKSKDLWIASWLLEALIRENNFAGLRDGFRMIREMVETYFDQGIHPQPDEELGEDLSDTVAQLTGLFDGALVLAIDQIPICQSDDGPLTSGDYKMSAALDTISDPAARQARIDEGTLPLDRFETYARNETSAEFLRNNFEDASAAAEEFKQLSTVLDAKFGYEYSPPTSSLKETLDDCLARMRSISKHVFDEDAVAEELAEEGASSGGKANSGATGAASGKVATREDAFRVLNQVAEFFERTEPHSLLPFALRQVVGWGKMTLPELLKELISDDNVLIDLNRRTGVPKIEDPEQGYQ